MALTLTQTGDWISQEGNKNVRRFTVDFDASYPTGGESLTAADMALATIDTAGVRIDPKSGYVFSYDYTNNTVLAYWQTDPADAGGANIALIQVADTTDLSAVTGVTVEAKGW